MLLGDASIIPHERSPKGACYLQFKHSTKQEEYALAKASLLEALTGINIQYATTIDKRTGNEYSSVIVRTRCHPFYQDLREAFYNHGHKVVPPFWLGKLNQAGLAYWYFDDGCFKKNGVCEIATLSYSWPENEYLSNLLFQRFGVHSKVCRHGKYPILRVPAKSRELLGSLVQPFATSDVAYKVPHGSPLRPAA